MAESIPSGEVARAPLTGESGPELFIPHRAGRVFTAAEIRRMLEGRKDG